MKMRNMRSSIDTRTSYSILIPNAIPLFNTHTSKLNRYTERKIFKMESINPVYMKTLIYLILLCCYRPNCRYTLYTNPSPS